MLGHARRPPRISRLKVGAVERRVDFDRRKHLGITSEMGAVSWKLATKCNRQRPACRPHAHPPQIGLVAHTWPVASTYWPAAYRITSDRRDSREGIQADIRWCGHLPTVRMPEMRGQMRRSRLTREAMQLIGQRRAAKAPPPDGSSRSGWERSLPAPGTSPGKCPAHTCTVDGSDSPAGCWPGRRLRPGG
jgi:hypothetical protein